ncbi:MAG: prolipoprotein diacylglyceryl transferase [Actinobacteria bacterium]|nr:prolipoprotein diacylglyceryl transferase [Actinomycetota bacterium]
MPVIAAMPSPSSGSLEVLGLRLNAYGLMIALGVVVAVRIAGRRAEHAGVGTVDDFSSIAMWAVPAGVLGGRAYHVITDLERFRGNWDDAIKIWQGGLGVWGGVTLGLVVGLWRAGVRGLDTWAMGACAAPAILVAQAIGRWGNWFNQELFGRPTDLPWALEVSVATARKVGYPPGTTFHPTFLYESVGCLALAWLLAVVVERRVRPARGRLLVWYAAGYSFLRFFVEGLRIDPTKSAGGWRLNQWVSVVVFAVATGFLVIEHRDRWLSRPDSGASTVSDHE